MFKLMITTFQNATALGKEMVGTGQGWPFAKLLMDMADGAAREGFALDVRTAMETSLLIAGENREQVREVEWECKKLGLLVCPSCRRIVPLAQSSGGKCYNC